jgi:hypothetical protein
LNNIVLVFLEVVGEEQRIADATLAWVHLIHCRVGV